MFYSLNALRVKHGGIGFMPVLLDVGMRPDSGFLTISLILYLLKFSKVRKKMSLSFVRQQC